MWSTLISATFSFSLVTCPITTSPTSGVFIGSLEGSIETLPSLLTTVPVRVDMGLPLTSITPFPRDAPSGTVMVEPGVTWSPVVADIVPATGQPPINGTEA